MAFLSDPPKCFFALSKLENIFCNNDQNKSRSTKLAFFSSITCIMREVFHDEPLRCFQLPSQPLNVCVCVRQLVLYPSFIDTVTSKQEIWRLHKEESIKLACPFASREHASAAQEIKICFAFAHLPTLSNSIICARKAKKSPFQGVTSKMIKICFPSNSIFFSLISFCTKPSTHSQVSATTNQSKLSSYISTTNARHLL